MLGMRNVPHRLMHLKIWSLVADGEVMDVSEHGALLEDQITWEGKQHALAEKNKIWGERLEARCYYTE